MSQPSKWRMMRGGRKPPADDMVQVGWVKWDGDEFYDFRYVTPEETDFHVYSTLCKQGWQQVFVAKQPEGY